MKIQILKRSAKYLVVALINLVVLSVLLILCTDKLELLYNEMIRPIEFLKIVAVTIASLFVMRIAFFFFRKRRITETKAKIRIVSILTLLVSSYLYIGYSSKLIDNRIKYRTIREQTVNKILADDANGTKASNLAIQEYQQVSKVTGFPKIPKQATNINYLYQYDGFLPDYYLELTYQLPGAIWADTFHFQEGDFSKSQTVEFFNDRKRVTYIELVK